MSNVNRPELFYSQSALGTYQNCPLKFRYRYLDGLYWPGTWALEPQGKRNLERGSLFHLLAQRYYTGGEANIAGQLGDDDITLWLQRLIEFRPFDQENYFSPEQELRVCRQGLRLVAKYDLLMQLADGRVVIYDWKTGNSPPKKDYWQNHLQTMVYRYMLCAAGDACLPYGKVEPDELSMIYWDPQYPASYVPLAYSRQQFASDEEFLRGLIGEIESKQPEHFLATLDDKRCRHCEYCPICLGERSMEPPIEQDNGDLDIDWQGLEELAIYY